MKIRHIILLVLLIILGLAGFGLQRFLTEGLADLLNQKVFPDIQSQHGLQLSVKNATVNLLQRRARLEGLTVRNLDGYHTPTMLAVSVCKLDVELSSLWKRDPIILKSVEAAGVSLIVERNKEGRINLQDLASALGTETAAPLKAEESAEETAVPEQAAASESPALHVRRLTVDGNVLWLDQKRRWKLPLDLRLTASDLFSIPSTNQPNSLVVLRGSHAETPDSFVVDLNAIVEPLTNPELPSFNAAGSVQDIDRELMDNLLGNNDMKSSAFSVEPSLICKEGRLTGSELTLTLKDLEYRDTALGDTALHIPVYGTLENPEYDLTVAIQSLFEKSSMAFLKALGIQEVKKESAETPDGEENPGQTKTIGDILADELGKRAKEIDQNKDLKNSLKILGDSIFGN